jgi:uncharacterized protein
VPTSKNGKICYLEIPSTDVAASAAFYAAVFGWQSRTRGDGSTAFDDTTGQVSGAWVAIDRLAPQPPGILVYVMVDSVAATLDLVVSNGGAVTRPIGADAPEITARVTDPTGNTVGLYQEPGA